MDNFGVGDMDKKFPFQGMNPKQMQQGVQNGMPQQQQDMQQQFAFFPQAVSMMSQAGIPTMQFSAPTGVNSNNFRTHMSQNPNLQQFPPQQQSNLIPNMSGGNQNVNFVPQLSQASQMTSPPSANSIISFPHLSQIQQSTPTNKNIHDEVINANSGTNVDQSAVSQDNGNTPNGLANPQSPAPVSGNNAQVSSPNSGSANNNNMSTAITPASPGVVRSLAPGGAKATYIDITPYLNMPQKEAARRLGIPTSTLSKRWKEAVRCRKWPYRTICKLDKEIMALLQNIPQDYNTRTNQLPEEIETTLGYLLRKRQEELQPVIIRV